MEDNNINPKIHNVKQGLILHKDSKSHEILTWNMFVSLAQFYSNNLSEETKKGLDEKAIQGWYPGSHKRGYKTILDGKDLEKFAYSLVGYFDLLLKVENRHRFGNSPHRAIDTNRNSVLD